VLKYIDSASYEYQIGETSLVIAPDYPVIPGLDNIQADKISFNSSEAELLCQMLSHFLFTRFESVVGEVIKEKMDNLNKPKPNPAKPQNPSSINKKQLLDIGISQKFRKSLHKYSQYCFESMKNKKDDWFTCVNSKNLKKLFPSIMDFKEKLCRLGRVSSDICNELETDLNRKKLLRVLNLEEMSLSADSSSLIYDLLISDVDHSSAQVIEYLFLGGDKIEVDRMKGFFKMMGQVQSQMDRSDNLKHRSIRDTKLSSNGLSILMTMFVYFYDLDNSGKILSEYCNISIEPMDKINTVIEQLKLYEQVSKTSLCCNGLMESPIWFFFTQLGYLRVELSHLDSHRPVRSLPVSQRLQIFLDRAHAKDDFLRRDKSFPVLRCTTGN